MKIDKQTRKDAKTLIKASTILRDPARTERARQFIDSNPKAVNEITIKIQIKGTR